MTVTGYILHYSVTLVLRLARLSIPGRLAEVSLDIACSSWSDNSNDMGRRFQPLTLTPFAGASSSFPVPLLCFAWLGFGTDNGTGWAHTYTRPKRRPPDAQSNALSSTIAIHRLGLAPAPPYCQCSPWKQLGNHDACCQAALADRTSQFVLPYYLVASPSPSHSRFYAALFPS